MIIVENLMKTFRSKAEVVAAIDGATFRVEPGEVVTLLGPSGCGKTTTLRCVAGLERPDGGRIEVAGQTVVDVEGRTFVPPHLRNLGMVFQSYAIWPHMTVYQNVAYALEGKRLSQSEMRKRAMDALALVQLEGFADRPAPRLSGGQQQRVAIARAIAGNPSALLFDEPLSNLDAKLRSEMRSELRRLQQQVGLTSIYVTHDQSEALAISDWIVVMRAGRIVEIGRPADIYSAPRNLFTAHFIGNTNLIRGQVSVVDRETGKVAVETAGGRLQGIDPNRTLAVGEDVRLSVRPEDLVARADAGPELTNELKGVVAVATFQGAAVDIELSGPGGPIKAHVDRDTVLKAGQEMTFAFADSAAIVLRDEDIGDDDKST